MTPNPKDPRFIIHEVPANSTEHMKTFYAAFKRLKDVAGENKWAGIDADNLQFEYSTYDENAEIIFSYMDKNEHTHRIEISLWHDAVSSLCWFSYVLKAENFASDVTAVQSYAESLMLQLWDLGIDAELCRCDWGLEFSSSIDDVFENMDTVITSIITSIKPMEWFYSDEDIWRCYRVYYKLKQFLPKIQEEASKGRWPNVKPENFILERDKHQAYITLRYFNDQIFNLSFKLGMQDNGFDEGMTGSWFESCYDFTCIAKDSDVVEYYSREQMQICKAGSAILDMIGYKMLFFYGEGNKSFGIIVDEDWAVEKFCLMLDVMLPLFYKHEATRPLITKGILEKKKQLEGMLGTPMEIVESKEPDYIFRNGKYVEKSEDPNIMLEDLPF